MNYYKNYKVRNIELLKDSGYWDMPEENADLNSGFSSLVVREMGCVVIDIPYNKIKKILLFGQLPFIEAYVMNRVKFIKSRHKTMISLSDIISVDPVVFRLNTQPRPDTSGVL